MPRRLAATTSATASALALVLGLAACGDDASDGDRGGGAAPATSSATSPAGPSPTGTTGAIDPDLAVARSETREDSVYPDTGDPLVDALHYDLRLTWDPKADELAGEEVLTFRATDDADAVPLAFNEELLLSKVLVDGADADFEVSGTDLVIGHAVAADEVHTVELAYAGTPKPTPAPSQRPDFAGGLGWTITSEHETWTMQEPYGAFTWYAVNDQPADKALYDFTLTVPAPWQGVANGELTGSTTSGGMHTNTWHLAEPASSYLVTVAFGDYQHTDLESSSGVPIQVWSDADEAALPGETRTAPKAIDWLEKVLGPYPFDTFGIVVVDNDSGMETQTMVTLGNTPYSLSAPVVVHEAAHHWYGDSVSPADWSEVWMNEGMAMYLQGMWEAEQQGITVAQKMDQWAEQEGIERQRSGPPAAYDPESFGDGNIYYGPALMWQELRERVGDDEFFQVLRRWPEEQENGNADREEYWSWIEKTTGEELTGFFEDWLLGKRTPSRD